MCGIFAEIGVQQFSCSTDVISFKSLERRGPDYFSHQLDSYGNFFYQSRLAIIDLDDEANQPFYKDGNFIVFNGEIYNYKDLRNELEKKGVSFRTNSDTEVLLEGILTQGEEFLTKLRGMFAFIIFDKKHERYFGARDRFGEKPLFYCDEGNRLLFSSDFRSIFSARNKPIDFNHEAFNSYLHYQFIPEPQTLDSRIFKVPAGNYFTCNLEGKNLTFTNFFKQPNLGSKSHFYDEEETTRNILRLLYKAVERTLVADVPVALSLSAGIDSGAIAAITRSLNPDLEIHAFTLGYRDFPNIDERPGAAKLASLLNIKLHALEISTEDLISDFPKLLEAMDEPIADPAAYPHYLIPKQASELGFKVLLNGIGGDEFNWGYWWLEEAIAQNKKIISQNQQKFFGLRKFHKSRRDNSNLYFYQCLEEFNSVYQFKSKIFPALDRKAFCEKAVAGSAPLDSDSVGIAVQNALISTWMVSNCLNLADRVGMFNSIETRMPFLDADLTEYLNVLTESNISVGLKPKYLLKKSLKSILPNFVLEREKTGFRIPNTPWMEALINKYSESLYNGKLSSYVDINKIELDKLILKEKRNWYEQFFLYKLILVNEWLEKMGIEDL